MPKPPAKKERIAKAEKKPKRYVNIRINPEVLSQDDVDYLYCLQHKDDPSYTLDELLKRLGYDVVRRSKKAS